MTLPKKEEKGYLELVARGEDLFILAEKHHAEDLAALFLQYGISCERRHDVQPGMDELRFPRGMNRAEVQRLLDGYKQAKGS
jgi:hypothetical protein